VYVSANNQGYSHEEYINDYPLEAVGEIHLAGHTENISENSKVLIDDHGSPVIDDVWKLFSSAIEKIERAVPVLIEWDTNIPDLSILMSEASKAANRMTKTIAAKELI
jgi:uncharacterized protein (UPF0276 family)